MYALVLIEYKVKSLDKMFTYKIPDDMKVKKGCRVKVPFGKQQLIGIVMDIVDSCDIETKDIIEIVNDDLILNDELLKLGYFIKDNVICSLMTAYQAMLPTSLKITESKSNYQLYDEYLELNKEKVEIKKYIENNKRAKVQNEILTTLIENKRCLKNEFNLSSIKKLQELNLIRIIKEPKYRLNITDENCIKRNLTKEQSLVVEKVSLNEYNTYLLHGVTGSGKTEVYMSLIDKVIKNKKTALVCVPEISLTTQIVNRFYSRFGKNVAILHSSLSQGEKFDEYKKILNGEVSIVVGTRSAIFAPLKNIGVIIIDEEHSSTYKQENNPRYNAIDCAKFRGEYNNCPVILGSATPSLESYARALKGVYKLLVLDKRVGNSKLPIVSIINMMDEVKKHNMILSDELKNKIRDRLNKKEQVMLLLNRRGFSTYINCQNCGYVYKCPHCEISLTYHKTSNQLRCHYCGYTVFKSNTCPNCKENAIRDFGLGTEKLEEEIKKEFKEAKIVRMDKDTTSRKGSHEKIIKSIESREYDIVIGTQMISKGLDFPYVTLVGVINADESLNIPDFRSGERTFSLLNQVSGRAGRSDLLGEVIIQTYNPDNITLNLVKNNDYKGLFNYEMNLRKRLNYPPYYYLLSIKICSNDYDLCSKNATKVFNYLNKNLSKDYLILGPTTASMFKIKNIYRLQIIIKYKKSEELFNQIKLLDDLYVNESKVFLEIDNNPLKI